MMSTEGRHGAFGNERHPAVSGNVGRYARQIVNPYSPPNDGAIETPRFSSRNPAKPLLYLAGGYGLVFGSMVFLAGAFVGFHVLVVGIVHLMFGAAAIMLARRPYSQSTRIATVAWSVCLCGLIIFLSWTNASDSSDRSDLTYLTISLTIGGAIGLFPLVRGPASR
ncbi:hypothetical protein [Stieleria maiorica]|nr:hypothetical protein [Stieleria maiorica]